MTTIDLRSDTLTKPSPAMLQAMFQAEVGDDVFGEDPTVNALQAYAADLLGMEAALFCSSGTQTNQLAINAHTRPGEEVICSDLAHVYLYEGGGIAQNSGCSVRLLTGDRGRFTAAQVAENINNPEDIHLPPSTLVCVENTVNKGGGAVWQPERLAEIRSLCDERGLRLHCDGARLFNALANEENGDPRAMARHFHSLSICLSKGLGAPVGSLLLGTEELIAKARRRRKSLGGGMRQAGFLAAAGLYALQVERLRLKEDHHHAQRIAATLRQSPHCQDILPVETNIVIWKPRHHTPQEMEELLATLGIRSLVMGNAGVRFVFHRDVTAELVEELDQRLCGLG